MLVARISRADIGDLRHEDHEVGLGDVQLFFDARLQIGGRGDEVRVVGGIGGLNLSQQTARGGSQHEAEKVVHGFHFVFDSSITRPSRKNFRSGYQSTGKPLRKVKLA